jgi:L-aspartate oxidase
MAYRDENKIETEVLILGSGIAGLLAAYELQQMGAQVTLATKGQLSHSNSTLAQGGLAAVTGANPLDTTSLHLSDTLSAGAGLTDERIACLIVDEGQSLVLRLQELGVEFDRAAEVSLRPLELAREGGHCQPRVLHNKDASGKAITGGLIQSLRQAQKAMVLEDIFALDLIVSEYGCEGARFLLGENNELVEIHAEYTILATGGLGQVFARTTNPAIATGDGIAMAFRAGASVVDMEFVQFHPTALVKAGAPPALISEAVRGAGAHLIDANGARFAFRYHQDGEMATRDVVARAILNTMLEQDLPHVWLDLRPIGAQKVAEKFPNIVASCRNWGIDPTCEPVPVSPAAHYFMGGVWTDDVGQTTVPRLFAIGECASTGLHGANRLASNSLLEGGVMARRAAEKIAGELGGARAFVKFADTFSHQRQSYPSPEDVLRLKEEMFQNVGLQREGSQLERFIEELNGMCPYTLVTENRAVAESANMALLGWLIARAALERKESRGAHWRTDYPALDAGYLRRYHLSKEASGWLPITPVAKVVVPASTAAATRLALQ